MNIDSKCAGYTLKPLCVCVCAGNVKDELLKSYSTDDTLMLCVRLAVLVAVTLTVPVVLFPVKHAHTHTHSFSIIVRIFHWQKD